MAVSYSLAERPGNSLYFPLFWAGMFVFTLPALIVLCHHNSPTVVRIGLLVSLGLYTYLPKLLRNPSGPLFHDEHFHWRGVLEVLRTQDLFDNSNTWIGVLPDYPGLHATTAQLAILGDIAIWPAATILLETVHTLTLIGVGTLAWQLWAQPRVAALAAVIYSLNSSFLYFDTQFAYESLGLMFVVWELVAFLAAIRSATLPTRIGWTLLAVALVAATVTTHHLSTLILVGMLTACSMGLTAWYLTRRPIRLRSVVTSWIITLVAIGILASWIAVVSPNTVHHLTPYPSQSLNQLAELLSRSNGGGGGRKLFSKSTVPSWERAAAFAAPLLMAAGIMSAFAWLRHFRRTLRLTDGPTRAVGTVLLLIGLVYFVSLPFTFLSFGSEGARRTWAFSYIGLALFVSLAIVAVLDWARDQTARRPVRAVAVPLALIAALLVVLMGNTAAGLSRDYRFPGPYKFGSDVHSVTPELLDASNWLATTQGENHRIVADQYSLLTLSSFGRQNPATPWAGFRTYDLYLDPPGKKTSALLINQLSSLGYTYLIVDRRMERQVPAGTYYFINSEPIEHGDKPPFPPGALTKFDQMPWTVKVFESDHYAIYRFDFASVDATLYSPPQTYSLPRPPEESLEVHPEPPDTIGDHS